MDDRDMDADPFAENFESSPDLGIAQKSEEKSQVVENPSVEKVTTDNPKKPTRERRFFKNRTKAKPVNYQYQIHNVTEPEETKDDTFKKPVLPGSSHVPQVNSLPNSASTSTGGNSNDLIIPVTERLSDEQAKDAELADDVTYYLEGVKSSQGYQV